VWGAFAIATGLPVKEPEKGCPKKRITTTTTTSFHFFSIENGFSSFFLKINQKYKKVG